MVQSAELKQLHTRNADTFADMIKTRDAEGKTPTQEEIDKYDADQAELSRKIRAAEIVERQAAVRKTETERKAEANEAKTPEQRTIEERYEEVFFKYIDMQPLERADREVLKEFRGTGSQTTTTTAGGFMIPEGFSNMLFAEMAIWGGMLEIANIMETDTGNLIPWPKYDDTAETGEWVAETVATVVGDIAFTEMSLEAWNSSSKIVKVSDQLEQDAAWTWTNILVPAFARRLGTLQNAAFTTGDGSSKPHGFITDSSSAFTADSATAVTRTELNTLVHSVNKAYRKGKKVGFTFNDTVFGAIKAVSMATAASDNGPLWVPGTDGDDGKLLGYPVFVNPDMAAMTTGLKPIAFGDFDQYKVRRVRGTGVRRLDELYATSFQKGYLANQRIDGRLLATNAIKFITMG